MSKNEFWENSLPVGYYDQVLEEGNLNNKGIQSNWHNTTFKTINEYVSLSDTHLDYACGPGTFIGKYTDGESIGVDISDDQIRYAKDKYSHKGEFIYYKDFEIKKYKNYFDVITVIGLLEFLDDKSNLKVLEDLYFMLKPGGTLLMTTPNFRSTMTLLVMIINKFSKVSYKNQHVNRLNKNSVQKLLKKSKFQKDEIKVVKFINFGMMLSFFSWKLGSLFNDIISRSSLNFFGYLLLVSVKKKL